jgi:menaquinone-9 beta-reductase
MHDVLIVGAGPAGASTAIYLARHGRNVLLLDRARFPRPKTCGEGLFPAGVDVLEDLGVLEAVKGYSRRLDRIRFNLGQQSVEAPIGSESRPVLGVQRLALDKAISESARAAGVQVITGLTARELVRDSNGRWQLRTDEGIVEAKVIVGADGLNSGLRHQAGLNTSVRASRYGVSAHLRLREPVPPVIDIRFHDGWETYLTPVAADVVNIALLARRPAMRRLTGDLCAGYLSLLEDDPAIVGGYELLDQPRATGPFPVACQQVWQRNLVLVGDAAGFFDGISGEGMSVALISARHCAEAVEAYLATARETAFLHYDRIRCALVRNSTLLARVSLAVSERRWTSALAMRNLRRRPETFAKLIAINAGELPLSALRPGDGAALALGI